MAKKTKAQKAAEFKTRWGYAIENETAEQRFRRLATIRVNKCLRQVSLLGNLAGSRYKSTSEQISKMEQAFKDVLTEVFGRLRGQKAAKSQFSL
jgi:hypothetical protein